jgi:hypothetical protein
MEVSIQVILKIIKKMVLDFIDGVMVLFIMVNGIMMK